jgi:hypothetical protein
MTDGALPPRPDNFGVNKREKQRMAVIGASPVSFISEDLASNHGKQYQIPLALLTIGNTGTIDASKWPGYASLATSDKTLVTKLLGNLVRQGLLTAPPA